MKGRTGALELSGETTSNGEGPKWGKLALGLDSPAIDGKRIVRYKGFAACRDWCWVAVAEIDAAHSLGDVQLARPPRFIDSIPIKDAIGGVAISLHFHDDGSTANRVHPAAGNEESVARFDVEALNELRRTARVERGFKSLRFHRLT